MPPVSRPAATHGSAGSVAATLTRMASGREPSAFMATTIQSPLRTAQVRVWVPGPAAWVAQMRARAGAAALKHRFRQK